MLAGRYNIICDQGSTFQRVIEIKDTDGTVYPLTGYTARMQIRREIDASATILELSTTNGRIVIYAGLGAIELKLTASETSAMARGGYYDLELVKTATGEVQKVLRGEFRLEKEVTR